MIGYENNLLQLKRKIIMVAVLFLVFCSEDNATTNSSQGSSSTENTLSRPDMLIDERIKMQVTSVIENASDLPPGFQVEVTEGCEDTGSVLCDECGYRTPGHIGTIQQSLGGIVRAVPGVMRVDFDLSYGPIIPQTHSENFK